MHTLNEILFTKNISENKVPKFRNYQLHDEFVKQLAVERAWNKLFNLQNPGDLISVSSQLCYQNSGPLLPFYCVITWSPACQCVNQTKRNITLWSVKGWVYNVEVEQYLFSLFVIISPLNIFGHMHISITQLFTSCPLVMHSHSITGPTPCCTVPD